MDRTLFFSGEENHGQNSVTEDQRILLNKRIIAQRKYHYSIRD